MTKETIISVFILLLNISGCAAVTNTRDGEWRNAVVLPAGPVGCELHLKQEHLSAPDGDQVLAREFAHHKQLVEEALVYRAKTIELGERLRDKSKPLSGADLQRLDEGMLLHLRMREALLRTAEIHECWLDLPEDSRTELTPRRQLEGVMLSLSAALVLYDNYLLAVSLFEQDERLRRVLNDSNSGYGIGKEILAGIALSYNSMQNRARVKRAIKFYEKNIRKLPASAKDEQAIRYLSILIDQSPSYAVMKKFSPTYIVGRNIGFMQRLTKDQLAELTNGGVSIFSMFFGNTVGLVETRKGKLLRRPDVKATLLKQLRAGDILLEKTPFRLTDALIPGHWGHAAVWVGSEEELRELGIWDHPVVARHHKSIRNGAGVVEALRSGVKLNQLARFLNIDDLAIMRPRKTDKASTASVVLNALRQVGKDYDFNFDVETADRIVCSELIYVTYTDIEWPTTKTLGRSTISPDQVAAKAVRGGPLELVLLYRDGNEVAEQRQLEFERVLGIKQSIASRD